MAGPAGPPGPARPAGNKPKVSSLDVIEEAFLEVLLHTGKALGVATKDGKGNAIQAAAIAQTKVPMAIERFHAALNDLESDIMKTRAILLRDLNAVKARRRPPPPPTPAPAPTPVPTPISAPVSEPKTVAPPAPMVIDLDSPPIANAPLPPPPQVPGPSKPTGSRPESKPVAPFPNMGFDLTVSPEITPARMPTPVMKTKEMKKSSNSPRQAAATQAAMAGRPSSAPPRKETNVLPPQLPRSATSTPQPPAPASLATSAPIAPPAAVPAAIPAAVPVAKPADNMFTDMAFGLAPVQTDAPGPLAGQVPNAQAEQNSGFQDGGFSNLEMGGGDNGNDSSLDNLDGMFDLGGSGTDGMDLDYDLGADGKSFDDLFSYGADDKGGNDFDFGI